MRPSFDVSNSRRESVPPRGLFLCTLLLFASRQCAAADRPSPEELTSGSISTWPPAVERDQFNGTVLLARNGQILFCRGYGMANLEHDVPCTPNTKFRLGSITKQFTAMAILILQERGKLAVTDKVKKYIPSAPKAWDDITIHHLLTHTSGIPNYTGFPDFLKTLRDPITLDALIAKFKDKPLDFKPGEKFKYSNSGYIVLGKIIDVASGPPYATFMKEAIFDPLEMHDTGYDNFATILKNRASGYSRLLGLTPANATYIDMSIPHAAGALYSTVLDLLKWDRALDSEKLLPREVDRGNVHTVQRSIRLRLEHRQQVRPAAAFPRRRHPGFRHVHRAFPAEKLLVVVLSNFERSRVGSDRQRPRRDRPWRSLRDPARAQARPGRRRTFWRPMPVSIRPTPRTGRRSCSITVTVDGNTLKVEPKGQARLVAIPESEMRYYLKANDSTLEFAKDAKGIVNQLTLLQDNRNITAIRVEPAAEAGKAEKTAPKVDSPSPKPPAPRPAAAREQHHDADRPAGARANRFGSQGLSLTNRRRLRCPGLAHLLGTDVATGQAARDDEHRPELNGGLHHRARATRVVQLFMSGAASQCDTFDYKPALVERNGRKFDPGGKVELFQSEPGGIMASPWTRKSRAARSCNPSRVRSAVKSSGPSAKAPNTPISTALKRVLDAQKPIANCIMRSCVTLFVIGFSLPLCTRR